eukprot:1184171-Prorocentrum_minimum.AAC.2
MRRPPPLAGVGGRRPRGVGPSFSREGGRRAAGPTARRAALLHGAWRRVIQTKGEVMSEGGEVLSDGSTSDARRVPSEVTGSSDSEDRR